MFRPLWQPDRRAAAPSMCARRDLQSSRCVRTFCYDLHCSVLNVRSETNVRETTAKRSFKRGRLSEQVVAELERTILEEYPEPGTRLPKETELADRFHVSRIVIREAMKVLEERGAVEVRAGRGTITKAPTPEQVKASLLRLFRDQPIPTLGEMERMMELREVLEEAVAGLAAVRATPEDLKRIAGALADMADPARTAEETIEADLRFHMAVAEASHNRF